MTPFYICYWSKKGGWVKWQERGFPTCEGDYDENSEHVRVLCQYTRCIHRHVLPAEVLYLLSYQLIKGGAPRSGHTGGPWDDERSELDPEKEMPYWLMLTYDIGKDEIPPSDKGPQLPHGYIGIKISWACFRNTSSELSIAQTSQHRGWCRYQERQHNSGTWREGDHIDTSVEPESASHCLQ